jgi:RNA-binding protein YhbY
MAVQMTNPLQNAALTINPNAGNPTMTLGKTTLSESMLSQIKTKLGL